MLKALGKALPLSLLVWVTAASAAHAQGGEINTGDTAFVIISTAFVLFMTPGLAFFYGGMVRRKNVLGTLMHCFVAMAALSVTWVIWGYSNAFGPNILGGWIGGFSLVGLKGVSLEPNSAYAATIPWQLHVVFQGMFAVLTPALIAGAIAERMRFSSYLLFIVLWGALIYNPLAHWFWAPDGWLFEHGALDFAGGTVVHISSGVSALVAAVVLGKRRDYPSKEMRPHNLPLTLLGTGILWFGWFGFNAGSALAANAQAVNAFVTTNTATASAAIAWMALEWAHRRRPTALGLASGAVAGLVAITPACGFVDALASIFIGILGSAACYFFVALKSKFGYDDSLDTFGVHGIGGTVGATLTGVFAVSTLVTVHSPLNAEINGTRAQQVGVQLLGVGVTWIYAAVGTFILLKIIGLFGGLRVSAQDEDAGLDLTQHGEEAYSL